MPENKRGFLIKSRKKAGLTQKEAAIEVGISTAAYCNIEVGKRNPSVKVAKALGQKFGFDWTKFFETRWFNVKSQFYPFYRKNSTFSDTTAKEKQDETKSKP